MSGKDDFHEKHPEANEWMEKDSKAKETPAMSGLVQRLARSQGLESQELAERIPDDTIRRTKYPVIEKLLPDGSIRFEADPGIIEGPRALVHR